LLPRGLALGKALKGSVMTYFISPAVGVLKGFFTAHPKKDSGSVMREKEALEQMVVDYHLDMSHGQKLDEGETGTLRSAVKSGNLGRVTDDYVQAMRHPFRSLISGELARLLLIQVQQQKVDVDGILDQVYDILQQNELTMRLIACIPCVALVTFATRFVFRDKSFRKRPLWADMRVCWWTLHRLMCGRNAGAVFDPMASLTARRLAAANSEEEDDSQTGLGNLPGTPLRHNAWSEDAKPDRARAGMRRPQRPDELQDTFRQSVTLSAAGVSALTAPEVPPAVDIMSNTMSSPRAPQPTWGGALSPHDQGHVLLQVHAMRVLSELVWPHRYEAEEKQRFLDDLDDLEAKEASREARLRTLDRMAVSYSFLRHVDQR
jgi:hypothetical protein